VQTQRRSGHDAVERFCLLKYLSTGAVEWIACESV